LNIHEELITIENKQNRTFQIFPNPGNGHQISLYFEKQDYDQVNCSIYDLSGKLRFNKSMEILKGETEKTLSLGDLPAGIYWIVLQNNHNREKIKYIVF
jgi:hypothetical protein